MTRRFSKIWLLLPALVAVILYGYTVRLPFFMDDGVLFGLIQSNPPGLDGFRFWNGATNTGFYFPYFRPLVFSIWEWQGILLDGRFDPASLHLFNVFVYGLTGCAIAALTRRLIGLMSVGVIAGVFFVAFPFNYNAAMWIASTFHTVAVLGIVLAVYFGILAAQGVRFRLSLSLVALFTFIAVFSHENGVLTAPLLIAALWTVNGLTIFRQRQTQIVIGVIGMITATYVALFLIVPRDATNSVVNLSALPENLSIFLQGLIYPTAALVRRVTKSEATTGLLYLLTAVTLIPLLVNLWFRSKRLFRLAAFGCFWYVFAALPSALLLETTYIVGSWRLLLVSAPGAAIFWGIALYALWTHGTESASESRTPHLAFAVRVIAVLIAVWGIYVSVDFLAQRRDEATLQADYLRALKAEIEQYGTGDRPLVINAPMWLNPSDDRRWLLTIGEGVSFVAGFVNFNWLYEAETGTPFPYINALVYSPTFNPPKWLSYAPFQTYAFGEDFTTKVREATDIYVTIFDGDAFYPQYVGSPGATGDDQTEREFGVTGVVLTDIDAVQTAPETIVIESRWRVYDPEIARYMPFFRISCGNEIVGESSGYIWGEVHPFWAWTIDEVETDRREVMLMRPAETECLSVDVRLVPEGDNENGFMIPHVATPIPVRDGQTTP
jgi:hypothetical protein